MKKPINEILLMSDIDLSNIATISLMIDHILMALPFSLWSN